MVEIMFSKIQENKFETVLKEVVTNVLLRILQNFQSIYTLGHLRISNSGRETSCCSKSTIETLENNVRYVQS